MSTTHSTPETPWTFLGVVSVDSGQLMLTDPAYIDSSWRDEPFEDIRDYRDTHTGAVMRYRRDFQRYDQTLEGYGQTPNQLLATGRWTAIKPARSEGFTYSYNGACQATVEAPYYGELRHLAGHRGAGVAFSSGFGDGLYPVFGEIRDGRIMKVIVDTSGEAAVDTSDD